LGGRFINASGAWRGEIASVRLGVIASAAKQSILSLRGKMDCFASLAAVIARERAGEEYRPHPEELAKQASRRMDATYGLTAILRDARKSALLRMRDATDSPITAM